MTDMSLPLRQGTSGREAGSGAIGPSADEFAGAPAGKPAPGREKRARPVAGAGLTSRAAPAWLQVAPFAAIFVVFFLVPLGLTVMVSFWDYNEYQILPAFTVRSYVETFEGCIDKLPELCVTFKTYLSTLKFCLTVWLVTLIIGFFVAYFLAFHVRSATMQVALFLICTIPFWTSNIIRTISWIPLLGRNGLVNSTLVKAGAIREPIEWLIYSDFSVIMSLVHLYTLFMIVPIFNSMMRIDRALIEAARDAGASGWQTI